MLLHVLLLSMTFLSLASAVIPVQAADVRLAWNPSLSTAVAGYKIYYGQSSKNYAASVDVGNVTSYTLTGLQAGTTYYFASTAYSTSRAESAFSNEVSTTTAGAPVVANFTATPTTGTAPLTVVFTNTSTGTITGWSWNFGDGTTSTVQHPSHLYSAPGTYTVNLTASGPSGTSSTRTAVVTVTAPPPPPPPPSSTNLVTNGGIEQSLWTNGAFSGSNPARTWATDAVHSGTRALKMSGTSYYHGYWDSPRVSVTAGTTYNLSLWVKTLAITNGVILNINWYDASQRWLSWHSGVGGTVRGTTDWRQLAGVVTAPSQAATAIIHLRVESTGGTAWIDDVQLLRQTPTTPPSAPSVTLVATPSRVTAGTAVELRWTVTQATTCTATGGWSGTRAVTGGTAIVSPTQTTTYGLACTGAGGTTTRQATVTVTTPPPPPSSTNLVTNGGIEQSLWTNGTFSGSNPVRTWATDAVHSGTRALKMSGTSYYHGYWDSPRVSVTAGTTYNLSLWVKTLAITNGVTLNINWYDASQRWLSWHSGVGGTVRGTTDWRQLAGVVTAPSQAATAIIHLRVESTGGIAWIDDVQLLRQTPSTLASTSIEATAREAPGATLTATGTGGTTRRQAPLSVTVAPPAPATEVMQYRRWEASFISAKTYANPFQDVTLRVQYTQEGATPIQGYGFWDGGSTFKVRMAFPTPGRWQYSTTASDPTDTGLHQRQGVIDVLPAGGANPLYRHGFLQVSADHRGLEHADGTPFLWLGETLWSATVSLSEAGFRAAIDDRRRKHFTVLQSNFARQAEADLAGDTPWADDRWNVRFMQKLDRFFDYANDAGMYLLINGLVDLAWDRNIPAYEHLVEMIAIRYAAHHLSFAAGMDDALAPEHTAINTAIARVSPRPLLTQHWYTSLNVVEQTYDLPTLDYVMVQTGSAGNLEFSCFTAMEWTKALYNRAQPKPVINGGAWYEGHAGGTPEMATQLGYLTMLSGGSGYTYGTLEWDLRDSGLPTWMASQGATYMQHLADLFLTVDGGRPLVPRHGLIQNQAVSYANKMVLGMTADGTTYVAFLPRGGTITLNLRGLQGPALAEWYDPFTGTYSDQTTVTGGGSSSFTAPFGTAQAVLVITGGRR